MVSFLLLLEVSSSHPGSEGPSVAGRLPLESLTFWFKMGHVHTGHIVNQCYCRSMISATWFGIGGQAFSATLLMGVLIPVL